MKDTISEEMKEQVLEVMDSFHKQDWIKLGKVLLKLQESTNTMITITEFD